MSRPSPKPDQRPLIALVDRVSRALQSDMVREAHRRGHLEIKYSHNAVFATLAEAGSRATDMADRAGITRQSMGEIIREMVALGILEMKPDPDDRRAKLVTFTEQGLAHARDGYGHIIDLEKAFAEEFGSEDYARLLSMLERVVPIVEKVFEQGPR